MSRRNIVRIQMKEHHKNILLIAGTGRNSGKTTLAFRIIGNFSNNNNLVAVKISPHFHKGSQELEPVETNNRFNLYLEHDTKGSKDTARMKAAGAQTVYYVEVLDIHMEEAFDFLSVLLPPAAPVVIESPALGMIIKPGVCFIVDHPQTVFKKAEILASRITADKFINSAVEDIEQVLAQLSFDDHGWHYLV